MELGLIMEMAAGTDPDRVAITDVDGTPLTVGALQDGAARAAALLRERKPTQVGFLAANSRAFPITIFATAYLGVPIVPLNYRLSDEQLGELLQREPGLVVVTDDLGATRVRNLGLAAEQVVTTSEILAAPAADHEPAAVDHDDIAVLLYTSGTTSAPKGAILRHRHLTAYVISTVEFAGAAPDDALLVSVPPYHIAGVATVLTNLYSGRRLVYLDPFEPTSWLETVRREGVTHAMVVPTMLARIVEHLGDADAHVPTLQSLAYGGAKMPQPVIERALRCFGDVAFTNAYGLTETSSTITVLGPDEHRAALASDDPAVRARLASAGQPVPGVELEVRDEAGNAVGTGVVGDVFVRGEQVSGEYVGVAGAIDDDGWFATRDRGWIDDDGYLFIEGRSDDTIIRGGENIAPAEIEDVLLRHEGVVDCAVVGVPDPEWGQRIAAAVVLRPGTEASPDDLRDWVRGHLRGSKTPDVVELRDELPHTDTGKLLRREVRASFDD
jgi:acyl-CoA synthetase (AMP-forming)/AMP-acid ligase II